MMVRPRHALAGPVVLAGSPAYAMDTLGSSVGRVLVDIVPVFFILITILAFVAGIFLFAKGLLGLRDASSNSGRGVGGPFTTILAAVMLMVLPEVAGVGMSSIFGARGVFGNDLAAAGRTLDFNPDAPSGGLQVLTGRAPLTGVENCLTTDSPVPCMARNVARNAVPIGIVAIFAFCFISGLFMLAQVLLTMAKAGSDQGRGLPEGFWTKAVVAILLINVPFLYTYSANTILGLSPTVGTLGLNEGSSFLVYSAGASGVFQQYERLIGYLFIILAFFGVLAFVRGLFVIKSAAEGRGGQATTGHGLVFMVAGILLANAKLTSCMVLGTIMGFAGPVVGPMCAS